MTLATTQAASATDLLVVALVTVITTLIVGVVTALLTRKGEHAKWLREQRYEAYVAFMIDMSTLTALLETKQTLANATNTRARVHAYTENASAAFEAVSLLGPRKVNAAGQRWVWAAKSYAENKTPLGKSSLAKARWQFLIVAGEILDSQNVTREPMTQRSAPPRSAMATTPS
jgi:hypothetical protein